MTSLRQAPNHLAPRANGPPVDSPELEAFSPLAQAVNVGALNVQGGFALKLLFILLKQQVQVRLSGPL